MVAECTDSHLIPLPLSREQQWTVHAVILDHVELALSAGAGPDAVECELTILEALEDGDSAFTAEELARIRHELAAAARALDTPARDREIADDLVERLDGLLAKRTA